MSRLLRMLAIRRLFGGGRRRGYGHGRSPFGMGGGRTYRRRAYGNRQVRVVGCGPGCLLTSLMLSIGLTILLNVLLRVL